MRHDLVAEGSIFRLRPVNEDDAPFIVELRTDPRINQFIHETSPDLERQREWIQKYYERPGDYYFLVESVRDARPEGTIGVYGIDSATQSGEWGRWVLRQGSLAALESVWLIFRVAFEQIGLERLYSRTLVRNQKTIAFHEAIGCSLHRVLPSFVEINGVHEEVMEHTLTRADWGRVSQLLEKRIQRLSERPATIAQGGVRESR